MSRVNIRQQTKKLLFLQDVRVIYKYKVSEANDMSKVAVITDSNSGITQKQAEELGIRVIPMPFFINGEVFYEDINLSQEEFYKKLEEGADISTSQPSIGDILDLWDKTLKEYDEIVHIPMSSGLSGSCETAMMLANDYEGKVFVVDNQRISVTQRMSVLDAIDMADEGMSGKEIKEYLEDTKMQSSIYITLDTLKYLKKGGRITPAAAALGTFLKLKPVLQIQGEKLDAYAKARTLKQAKTIMTEAIMDDFVTRFNDTKEAESMNIAVAYSGTADECEIFKDELQKLFPEHDIMMDPLSLSVSCHIGPGAVAVACAKKRK